jgi:hypothetical protein
MSMWWAAAPPDDQVQPGWLGFFVVLALGIVTYLLWRSMNTHLKRVNFEQPPTGREDGGADDGENDGANHGAIDGAIDGGAASRSSGEPTVDDGAGDAGDDRPGSNRHDL